MDHLDKMDTQERQEALEQQEQQVLKVLSLEQAQLELPEWSGDQEQQEGRDMWGTLDRME